ncbi:MAG: FKBP-type peptidyl-prolyl cis-trans isomerase [Prevotella sp.]|nr:FKBP-type peptidyl-prolyl cis-trans isomerase [Prevotella sp.]
MKKIALLAMAVVLSASLSTAEAAKKKDKKKQSEAATVSDCCVEQPPVLTTQNDSLSFAAGKVATIGLMPYLQQQMNVDTAYMADFVKGYQEAVKKQEDLQFAAYLAGTQIAQMAKQRILPGMKGEFEGSEVNIDEDIFHKGFVASLTNDNRVYTDSAAQAYFEESRSRVKEAMNAAYKAENEQWLEQNKQKEGVVTLPSGLQYKVLTMGTGEKPMKEQTVEVKYEGKMIDGTVFDSSYKRNPQTSKFRCDQVISGWTEALQLMPVGSKWELYIPQNLAYRERQAGQIKPFSTLIFTVELIGIEAPAKPAETPVGNTEAKKVSKKK